MRRGVVCSGGLYLVLGGVCSGGCLLAEGGVPGPRGSAPGGCLLPTGVYLVPGGGLSALGRLLPGTCTWSWGVSALGGVCSGGCLLRRVYLVRYFPPVDRHTPVNILPRPKLRLRPVIIEKIHCITHALQIWNYASGPKYITINTVCIIIWMIVLLVKFLSSKMSQFNSF